MELKQYLDIFRRRWLVILIVPLIVFVGVVYQFTQSETTYTATARLTATREPQQLELDEFRYNEYYLYIASEFMIDDLVELVQGNVFAADLRERLEQEHDIELDVEDVQEALSANRRHRILTINASDSNEDIAVAMSTEAIATLQSMGTTYFGFDTSERGALIEAIEAPDEAKSSESRDQLILLVQIAVAVFAGLFLALLLDYMDDSLRTNENVELALDLPVLATIPVKGASGDDRRT